MVQNMVPKEGPICLHDREPEISIWDERWKSCRVGSDLESFLLGLPFQNSSRNPHYRVSSETEQTKTKLATRMTHNVPVFTAAALGHPCVHTAESVGFISVKMRVPSSSCGCGRAGRISALDSNPNLHS